MDVADAAEAGAVDGPVSPEDELAQQAQRIAQDIAEQAQEQTQTDNRQADDNRREAEQTLRNIYKVFLLALFLIFAIIAFAFLAYMKSWQANLGRNIAFWSLAVVIILTLIVLTLILSKCLSVLSLPLWLQPDRNAAPAVTNDAGPELGAVGAGALPLPTALGEVALGEHAPRGHSGASGASEDSWPSTLFWPSSARSEVWSDDPPPCSTG